MTYAVATVLNTAVIGSTKNAAVEILHTRNDEPYFMRVWNNGRSADIGYFATWSHCMAHLADMPIEDSLYSDYGNIAGLSAVKTDDGTEKWMFVNAEEAKADVQNPAMSVIKIEDMREPDWDPSPSGPQP